MKILFWIVGIGTVLLIIQNRKKVPGWFTNGKWKIWAWSGGVAATLALGVWAILKFGWLYTLGGMGTFAVIALLVWLRSRKTGSVATTKGGDGVKKLLESLLALAKLAFWGGLAVITLIFLTNPRALFEDWYIPPSGTPTNAGPYNVAIPAAPFIPLNKVIVAPHGNTNAPPEQWSEKVTREPGWLTDWEVEGRRGILAVLEDEQRVSVVGPNDFIRTEGASLRFITVDTNQPPLQIRIAQRRR